MTSGRFMEMHLLAARKHMAVKWGGENKLGLAVGRGGVICKASSSAALPGKC